MSRRGLWYAVVPCLLIGLAWPALGGQAKAEEPRYQERTVAQWQGDLKDPSPEVRRKATLALAHFGPVVVGTLVQALKDVDVQVRVAAAWTLGEMSPPPKDAVPALAQALGDLNVQVKQTAGWALSRFGPAAKDAVPDLIRALKDSNVVVRAGAAQALGAIGPAAKDAALPLAQMLEGSHSYLGGNVMQALRSIGPAAISELQKQAEQDPQLQPLVEEAIRIIESR